MLHSISQQSWKTQQWPQDWKRSIFILIPKKGNAKECSNYHKFAVISQASKTMLKILQARLQQYVNLELPGVQTGFRKDRDITLPTEVHIVKAMVFPLVMYRCESWIIKKGWALKHWCFQIVVLEKTLESTLDHKKIRPVYPKGIESWIFIGRTVPELQYFGPLMQNVDSLELTPMLANTENKRRRLLKRMRWVASLTQWTWIWTHSRR